MYFTGSCRLQSRQYKTDSTVLYRTDPFSRTSYWLGWAETSHLQLALPSETGALVVAYAGHGLRLRGSNQCGRHCFASGFCCSCDSLASAVAVLSRLLYANQQLSPPPERFARTHARRDVSLPMLKSPSEEGNK